MNSFSWKRVWYVFGLISLAFVGYGLALHGLCTGVVLVIMGPFVAVAAFIAGVSIAALTTTFAVEGYARDVFRLCIVAIPLAVFAATILGIHPGPNDCVL
jgi:hypothetical protein